MEYWEKSISFIREFEDIAVKKDPRGFCVCSSWGKDSMVLIELFRMAGVKFFIQHNVTGIDPPKLVYFGREQKKRYESMGIEVFMVKPRMRMNEMIVKNKCPPTRIMRYCCTELKERKIDETKNCFFSFGVRKTESANRSKREALEIIASSKKNGKRFAVDLNENEQLMLFSDNADARRDFEHCRTKGVMAINPIIWWTDSDVWDFTEKFDVPQCELYQQGYKRLGCVGCPMNSNAYDEIVKNGFEQYYLKAFEKMLEARKKAGNGCYGVFESAESVLLWWTSRKKSDSDESQTSIFDMVVAYEN